MKTIEEPDCPECGGKLRLRIRRDRTGEYTDVSCSECDWNEIDEEGGI